jgi:hypothetical protein
MLIFFVVMAGEGWAMTPIFEGETYNDDRMFVLYVAPCTVRLDDDVEETVIYHEGPPSSHQWCLVTYRNVPRYRAVRVDHFGSREAAESYRRKVEPTVPLISLGGSAPRSPLSYDSFVEWKIKNGLAEYDYRKMYSEGGSRPQEIMWSKRSGSVQRRR